MDIDTINLSEFNIWRTLRNIYIVALLGLFVWISNTPPPPEPTVHVASQWTALLTWVLVVLFPAVLSHLAATYRNNK